MSRQRPQKCQYCGNKYVWFDLHWPNCEGNADAADSVSSKATDGTQDPSESYAPADTSELDTLLDNYYAPIKLPDNNRKELKKALERWKDTEIAKARQEGYDKGMTDQEIRQQRANQRTVISKGEEK